MSSAPYFFELTETESFLKLKNDILKDKVSHCYLFLSEDDLALKYFTSYFIATLFCNTQRDSEGIDAEPIDKAFYKAETNSKKVSCPCLNCLSCRKVLSKTHEDVGYYPLSGEKITPDDVKDLIDRLSFAGGRRVFVLNSIDEASAITQNKLLKTLEEPPKDTILILNAKNISKVLNTILSRAKIINIERIKTNRLAEGLLEHCFNGFRSEINEKKCNWASVCSLGNIGFAERLLMDEKYEAMFNTVYDIVCSLKNSKDLLVASQRLICFKDDAESVIDFFSFAIRDIYLYIAGKNHLVLAVQRIEQIQETAKSFDVLVLADIQLKLAEMKKRLSVYCQAQIIFEQMLIILLEGRAKCRKSLV